MEDREIIELYFLRSEAAIAETERKYGAYCRTIAHRILGNKEDAEEVVNDTYLKVWNSIPPGRPETLKSYVGMISRRLSLDAYEARHTQKRYPGEIPLMLDELAECIPDHSDGMDMGESFALREALNRFVAALPDRTRIIFLRRYWYAVPLAEIARDFSMKEGHVATLMFKTRKQLKNHLKKEGFDI